MGRWEKVLPDKLARSVGVFFGEGIGESNLSKARCEVFLVEQAHTLDLTTQVGDDGFGKRDDAILFPFAIADGNGLVFEINVLDAQADTFHQTQARAIEQLCHKFVGAVEMGEDAQDLVAGEDGGEAFGSFGTGKEDGLDIFVQDVAVEEEDGAEGLILGGSGDVFLLGEVGEESLDFWSAHFEGVTFVMEEDEAFDPVDVGFFGAIGIMFEAQGFADLVEKFFCHRRLILSRGCSIIYVCLTIFWLLRLHTAGIICNLWQLTTIGGYTEIINPSYSWALARWHNENKRKWLLREIGK